MLRNIFKHLNNKVLYALSFITVLSSIVYMVSKSKIKAKTKLKGMQTYPLSNNPKELNSVVKDLCKDDHCFTSISITTLVRDMITTNGLENTINAMVAQPEKYQTYKGDYVFIFRKIPDEENGGYKALYHSHKGIHDKPTLEANKNMLETCPSGKCDVVKVIRKIGDFTNEHKQGFLEYVWYDPVTNDTIVKRSYVEKIDNLKYKDEVIPVYIGSGYTLKQENTQVDYNSLIIYIITYLVFISLWNILEVSELLRDAPMLKNGVFIVVTMIFAVMVLAGKKRIVNIDDQEDALQKRVVVGGILSGLTLSLSLFFRAFVNIGMNSNTKRILRLFTAGFIGAILTLIDVPTERTFENVLIKTQVKNSLILITTIFFTLSVLSIIINFKN